jgi:ribose transport system ATP-binding protein
MIRSADEEREARQLFERIGLDIRPETRCRDLTVAQQQKVEIAKALSLKAKIVVMDEPTAALATKEVEQLFAVIEDLKAHGIGVIYISHRLEEIFEVADWVMVLRDGECVGCDEIGKVTRDTLIETMVGRPIESEFPRPHGLAGSPASSRRRPVPRRRGSRCEFPARSGEILGMAGLAGAGRTETMRLVFGADRPTQDRSTWTASRYGSATRGTPSANASAF